MSDMPQQIPLFPLSGHVLPGGTMRLRIFEPRYIRMVKQVCGSPTTNSIGMCMLNDQGDSTSNSHIHPIGTAAEIIDFEQLPDGLLGITVAGKGLFRINDIRQEQDGLRMATVSALEIWPAQPLTDADSLLVEQLLDVYAAYPELAVPYQDSELQQAAWVCLRWLELLPIAPQTKQDLLQAPSVTTALNYLKELILESQQA